MSGDWYCLTCQRTNFHWRTKCRRCKEPLDSVNQVQTCPPGPRVHKFRRGDWLCDNGLCRAHNFSARQYCFKCGLIRSVPSFDVGHRNPALAPVDLNILLQRVAKLSKRGWTTGDWFCLRPDCNSHNYGPRIRCYKCRTPREDYLVAPKVSGLAV